MLNEKDFQDEISKLIRNNRNLKKISCEKLAELSETDYSSINLIENRKQNPKAYTLYKILFSLDIDLLKLTNAHIGHISDVEGRLINKISLLDETSKQDLLKFLEDFQIKSK